MKRLIILLLGLSGPIFLLSGSSYSNSIDELNTAIQAKAAKWVAKETPVSDIPDAEWGKRIGSREDPGVLSKPLDNSFYTPMSVPSSFDWTQNGGNYVTSIKNQGSCAACGIFTVVAAMESKFLINHHLPWVDLNLSEQIVLSCAGVTSCKGGGLMDDIVNFLQNTGTYLETCYPFTEGDGDCSKTCPNWRAHAYKVDWWSIVVNYHVVTQADLSAIKNALYTNGPLAVHMKVYKDFYSYAGGIYSYVSGGYVDTHWVLLVGWDDSKAALKCKNSWGTGWGEDGFFWISYNELYGNGLTELGRVVLVFGDTLQVPVASGPDLIGEWKSLTQTCKNSSRGMKCSIAGSLNIQNAGNESAPSSYAEIYFSDGQNYLKRISVGKLKVGGNKTLKVNYSLPTGQTASGKEVIAVIDPDDTIVETNEGNNIVIYGPIP